MAALFRDRTRHPPTPLGFAGGRGRSAGLLGLGDALQPGQVQRLPEAAPELDLDETERLFPVFQRLSEAQRTYVPAPYAGRAVLHHFTMLEAPNLMSVAEHLTALLRE